MKAIHNAKLVYEDDEFTVSKIVKFQNESNSQLYASCDEYSSDCVKDR